jgi:hypothetical protein
MLLWHVETDEISININFIKLLYFKQCSMDLSKAHEALLAGFERKILRRIHGAVQIDELRQRRYNTELHRLFNDFDIIKIIKRN